RPMRSRAGTRRRSPTAARAARPRPKPPTPARPEPPTLRQRPREPTGGIQHAGESSMAVKADQVKELRDRTGAGMMECKKALLESNGDFDQAVDALRKSGIARAASRADRAAQEGRVEAYIHPGNRVGVLIEVNCETDFVARTAEFGDLVRNLAMQVAAAGAEVVRREEVPAARLEREREIISAQLADQGKPAAVVERILQGKLDKFY